MATGADDEAIEGPSCDGSQVSLETDNFKSAVSFALRCLQSSGLVLIKATAEQGCPGVPWRFYSILRMSKLLYTY